MWRDRSLLGPESLLAMVVCACTLLLSRVGSEFALQPLSVVVMEGQSAVLTCALAGIGTIQWTFEAATIPRTSSLNTTISRNSSLFAVTRNDTYSELRIARADHLRHSGYYQCVDDSGYVSIPAQVRVLYLSDDISIDKSLITVYAGSDATFICTPPSAEPLPAIRWESNGIVLTRNQHVYLSRDNTVLRLTALTLADSGIYYCIAENGLGISVNASTELRTLLSPSGGLYTVKVPYDQFCAKAGRSLSIDCLISPLPKIEMVRWLYKGLALTSGIDGYYLRQNFTLKINSVSTRHAGAYCCVVEGFPAATDCTEVIVGCENRLQVEVVPPYFSPAWTLLFNFSYTNVMLKANPVVRWFRDSIPVQQDKYTSLLPNGSLLIQHVNLQSDIGSYTVMSEHISNYVLATYVALPSATVTPSLQLLASNPVIQLQSSVTLTCSFTSSYYRGFTYRWFLNNSSSPLSSDSRHAIYTSGTNSTLYISNLAEQDAGKYLCAVWEANVSVSTNLTLASYLYQLPLTLNQQPTLVCNGSTLNLECPFAGGRGKINVRWLLNDELLINDVGGVKLGQDGRVLTAASLQSGGVYACNVSDGFTSFYQSLPVIVAFPGSIEAVHSTFVGSAVRLDCIVSGGLPSPHIIWLQGWVPVSDLNDSSLIQLPNGSLLINPVTAKDDHTYYCAIQMCSTLDIKKFNFRVVPVNTSTTESSIKVNDIVLPAGLAFSGVVLVIAIAIFISVFCCCYHDHVREQRTTTIRQRAQLAGALRRQASMRASGRRDNGSLLAPSVVGHEVTTFTIARGNPPPPGAATQSSPSSLSVAPTPVTVPHNTPTTVPHNTPPTSVITSSPDADICLLPNFPRVNVQLREVMGEGEFGPVVLGWAYNISPLERSEVAVKVIHAHNAGTHRAVLLDFASQMQLQNPNICGILGLCTDVEPYYVIYEYLDKGDLKRFLLEAKETQSTSQKDLCNIVAQITDGMAFLYSQRIIHGDLATRNCLISSELKVKIADLGIGHDLYKDDYYDNGSQLLPIRWMAPELLTASTSAGPNFSLHSDVWSFGVLCWEVFTFAAQPYDDLSDVQILEQVPRGHTLTSLAKVCPALFHSIMQACWSYKLDERPKFSTLNAAIRKVTADNYQ